MSTSDGVADAQGPARHRLAGFIRRHPYATALGVFTLFGQPIAFIPVIARRVYGVELDVDLILIVPTLLFLLLPVLVITRITWGREGLRTLARSMVRFRVRVWWYLLPLVVVPGLTVAATMAAPSAGWSAEALITAYVAVYLPALFFQFATTNWWEETVWIGFVQAPLQQRFGPWRAVLLATPFFALQHISLMFDGTFASGAMQFALLTVVIIPIRALLAWMYNRTGSIALVGLVHAASNAAAISLVPHLYGRPGDGGISLLGIALVVILATRGRLGFAPSQAGEPAARDEQIRASRAQGAGT